ncbi:TPA: hypothetical protein J7685_004870 [Escherichia coli]|uniref:hypothetical protein n=1 Tax=Escherichia coli TaxID=562 RepID=UPI001B0698DA|nr:hypothetical protein [Escherichia coli]EIY0243688.1 hypothetical protein [Escherichia coli]MCK3425390.1 hypothetical protein [Escherichia coli]HAZ7289547.1 hypothetical protein [Escherichia coli]HCO6039157.1 hypothetical protein [Escherichia coli]HCO7034829.1 hypothetical protein [Escherichia coli]
MKTKRSLVVRVTLITATLLLTACAQPEQSSLAGDWLLTPKDKTRGLTGSIAVNIALSRCKTNCRGDNLPDNTRRWQLSGGNEKELTYLHDMSAQEKAGLNPGWQCYTSFFMQVCQGKPGTRPIVNEDYVSESGFIGSMIHVGIIELRRCQSENCQQELKAINTH